MYIILVTKHGKLAKIDTNEFPHVSRGSKGVKAISLNSGSEALGTDNDEVISAFIDPSVDSLSERELGLTRGLTFNVSNNESNT